MFIRYNEATDFWEYDTSAAQTGAGPWVTLPVDFNKLINKPTGGLTPHHLTHETGGSDVINNIDGSVIKTGSIADARLSANVALKNINNNFTVGQSITGNLGLTGAIVERGRTIALGEWNNFNTVWVSTGTQPSIGNGQLVFRYTLVGKTVHFKLALTIGSTTALGTGQWFFSLPFQVQALVSVTNIGSTVFCVTGGGGTYHNDGILYSADNANVSILFQGVGRALSPNQPFNWVSGDYLRATGSYEIV